MRLIEGEAHSLSQPDFASQCVCARASRQSFGQSSASAAVQTVSERSQDFTPGKKKLKNILVFLTANTPGAASGQIASTSSERSGVRRAQKHWRNTINLLRRIVSKKTKLLCDKVALSEMWIELHFMKYFWFMSLFLEPVCWCFCRSSAVHTVPRGRIKPLWDVKKKTTTLF